MLRTVGVMVVIRVACAATACPGQTCFVEAMTGDPLVGGQPGEVIDNVHSGRPDQQPPRLGTGGLLYRVSTQVPNTDGHVHMRFGPVGAPRSILQSGSLPLPQGTRMNLAGASTRVTSDGYVVVLGQLLGDGVAPLNDEAFLTCAPDGTTSLFRKGDQLFGEPPGVTLGGASYLRHSWLVGHRDYRAAPGGVASVAAYVGSLASNQTTGRGSALVVPGATSFVSARGYAGPGLPGSPVGQGTIHEVAAFAPSVNTRGEQAFVYTSDSASGTRTGIAIAGQGALHALLDGDTPVASHPGLLATVSVGQLGWNDAGQVAFAGLVRDGAAAARQGVFILSQGALTLLAQAGDPLPGRVGETLPASLPAGHAPRLASDGSVAFDTGTGIWFRPAGADPRMLFCEDSLARPQEIPDLRLATSSLSINASGQAVAALYRPGTSTTSALVAYDQGIGEVLIAAVGRSLELRPGLTRQVQQINFTGAFDGVRSGAGQDGAPIGINAGGQIAFGVTFTTGETAVLVATVPAPASTAIVLPGLVSALCRRRGRGTLLA